MSQSLPVLVRSAATSLGLSLPELIGDAEIKFVLLNALAALERARVVGALDAWEDGDTDRKVEHPFRFSGDAIERPWCCALNGTEPGCAYRRTFRGETRDAARAAAAKAIEAGEV